MLARSRVTSPTQLPIRPHTPVGRHAEPLRLLPEVGAGRLDPFEARPASQEPAPSIDALMSHYLSDFAFRSFPFYTSRSLVELWWPFVRSDEVLFNVVLLLSGLDRDRLQVQQDSINTQQQRLQCLTLLNARISDPVAGVNDHTLVAIASLAVMEHDRGNMKALDMVSLLVFRSSLIMLLARASIRDWTCFWWNPRCYSLHAKDWANERVFGPLPLDPFASASSLWAGFTRILTTAVIAYGRPEASCGNSRRSRCHTSRQCHGFQRRLLVCHGIHQRAIFTTPNVWRSRPGDELDGQSRDRNSIDP